MDFSSISLAGPVFQVLSFAIIIVSAYCLIWSINKVIHLIKDDFVSSGTLESHNDPFSSSSWPPPTGDVDHDPNGNYFRRDGMWRKFSDFE